MKKIVPFILLLISIGLFFSVLRSTHEKVGQFFPGYLTFENGVVGAFYVPGWSGPAKGLTYHVIPSEEVPNESVFTGKDFILVSVLPAIAGLLFFLLGLCIFFYLQTPGQYALLGFHFLVGNYLILCPDFHITYNFSYVLLICFALIPATVIHFSLLFPEEQRKARSNRWLYVLPYIVSFLLMVPYLGFFHQPSVWVIAEAVVFSYMVFSYFFWIYRLIRTLKHPQLETNKIIAKYLLLGQVIAFAVPLFASLAIFITRYSFPLNFAAPFSLLFPIALFMGVLLARLQQSQVQLVQSEKNAALGNLLAGLAHEINNPMTFVYSSLEPLKELLVKFKTKPDEKSWNDIKELIQVIEEGATRSKDIVESFRYFSHPDQKEVYAIDLSSVMDQSIQLLKPQWKDRIEIVRHYEPVPKFHCQVTEIGQVFVNLLSNACYAIADKGKIDVSIRRELSDIVISVQDTGVGMTKDVMKKIFDPFFTTKPQGLGTGLGLSMTLKIVKKYNGTIDVKSEMDKGTEIILRFPIES